MPLEKFPVPDGWEGPLSDFATALASSGRSAQTIRLRMHWLRRFARDLGAGPWSIEATTVVEWSGANAWALDTRKSAHCTLRAFYEWAHGLGYVNDVPVIPGVRSSDPAPRPASPSAIAHALRSEDPRVVLMVRLGAEIGLRRGEVARVHTRDLIPDIVGWSLIVHGKGGKTRVVPLTHNLADTLLALPAGYAFPGRDHGHLSPQWVGKLVGRALPAGVTMHALRHSFASKGFAKTRNLVAVQHALGHASPSTTLRYILLPPEDVREVVEAVA